MLANHNQDFLHLGVAISPIVDLRLYGKENDLYPVCYKQMACKSSLILGSTFSEKYMGLPTPTGNYHGYQVI